MPIKTLSIIIPVFNEAKTIHLILDMVRNVELIGDLTKEIVLVDDCSSDGSYERLQEYKNEHPETVFSIQKHEVNKGKGAALHTGIREAKGDLILIQDADLEYDPLDYNDLIRPILQDRADVVYGSRFMGGKPHRILFFWHSLGNAFLTFLSNAFTNLNLTDMETCYKVFKSEHIKLLRLKENRFGFEPEVTAKISRIPDIRIYEIGIAYYGRTYADGKKIGWKDGLRAIYCILKYNTWAKG
ncbi:MAG: hypothetical protein RLZZ337_328 [Bacteroidota bacterium]|jgi:glycosyltransferase involved in cell wall biosynthesis